MSDRNAQEFWDQMWYWERYETYPDEQVDDPHLVLMLGGQIQKDQDKGQALDPELMGRFDHSVGRVLNRLTNLLPRSLDQVDLNEFKQWLRFGLDPNNRGHDGTVTPIIDANSLVNFLKFTRLARDFCTRHSLADLGQVWASIDQAAQEVDRAHQQPPRPSRFDAAKV